MGLSQMRERFRVFKHSAPTVSGVPTTTYTMVASGAPDGAFAASRGIPGGRELTIAGARDQKADALLTFWASTPLDPKGALRDMADGRLYVIVAPIQQLRRSGRVQVIAQHAELLNDDTIKIVGEP